VRSVARKTFASATPRLKAKYRRVDCKSKSIFVHLVGATSIRVPSFVGLTRIRTPFDTVQKAHLVGATSIRVPSFVGLTRIRTPFDYVQKALFGHNQTGFK